MDGDYYLDSFQEADETGCLLEYIVVARDDAYFKQCFFLFYLSCMLWNLAQTMAWTVSKADETTCLFKHIEARY